MNRAPKFTQLPHQISNGPPITTYIPGGQFCIFLHLQKLLLLSYFSTQGCQKAWGSEVAHIFDTFPEKDKGKDNDYSRAAELFFYRRKI
jgi:hypothetical protein